MDDEDEKGFARVGRFRIGPSYACEPDKVSIHIIGDGEGGDFDAAALEAVLAVFYKDHF